MEFFSLLLLLALGIEPVDARGQAEEQADEFHTCKVNGPNWPNR